MYGQTLAIRPPARAGRDGVPTENPQVAYLRNSRRHALRQRARIVMASMVYTPVCQIALICKADESHVHAKGATLEDAQAREVLCATRPIADDCRHRDAKGRNCPAPPLTA
jgi:hypothetical protein